MKLSKIKSVLIALAAVLMLSSLCLGLALFRATKAYAEESEYEGAYRNRLAYSAKQGWNNDPNGLLYVNGVWHMYYQYNWNEAEQKTELGWGHMSWGHATSTDLVHWTEKPVALPEGQQDYAMMFSGSAVYDEYNTSGLFDTDGNGKVVEGQGIVALLTQPTEDQRQILAYSKDNGDSFTIYGEVIGRDKDGGVGDNEFRDPKVFRSEKLNKWLVAVGGGSVRMYSSENLKDWEYLGQTGYWGECPDVSRFEVDGEEKYVLIISPEDKDNSHKYNKTNRAETYYPAEYYVVGDLDENGLFTSNEPVRRLSEGIDSYAFQSFNNTPDGKVYGVSWSASWKTCDFYRDFRKTYNGGITIVTQLNLVKENGSFVLTRNPVEKYADLRGDKLAGYSGKLAKGENALANVNADVADMEIELDFSGSNATSAELWLRVSAEEKIRVSYDLSSGLLTLDRSQSSLLAKDTKLYTVPYSKKVELKDGKLSLRVLLDRAFVNVFADGGKASFFSAVFPSAVSTGMALTADGDIDVKADVYKVNGIFNQTDSDELVLTTNKIDGVAGKVYPVIASSFSAGFNASDVAFSVVDGQENVSLEQNGAIAYLKVLKKGFARIRAAYNGQTQDIEVYGYNDGWVSQVDYIHRVDGFSYYGDNGLFLADGGNGFRFSDTTAKNFVYSAEFAAANNNAQAAGLVFGVSDNLTSYYVATADVKDKKVKIWQAGVGDLAAASYSFGSGKKFKINVVMSGDTANVFIDNDIIAAVTCKIADYSGGKLGLNVFNGEFNINNVKFTDYGENDVTTDDGVEMSEFAGKSFVYSAEFTPESAEAKGAALVFGFADDAYWLAYVDIKNGQVALSHSEDGVLKTADCEFKDANKIKITLVVNDETAKIFIGRDDVAALCCKVDGYSGGRLGLRYDEGFSVKGVSFIDTDLPEGDIYCNGYEILKVVNITDGNRKLLSAEYSVKDGVLTVSRDYLKTLESGVEYTFRAVTSFTDFDFKITTDFTAVTVTPAVQKYYRNDEVTLELSGSVTVEKLLIDGKECGFTQTGELIKISADATNALTTGSHTVKLYTNKGRPETTIQVSEIVETITEPAVKASHVFLWIDLAIFLSAIIGYATFSIISKRKKK